MDKELSPSGRVRETRSSSANGIFTTVVNMLDPWKKQLEAQFRKDMQSQRVMIRKLEESDNSSMLEKELQGLRKELEDERDLRLENVKYFMECIETITDKVVELGAQHVEMQGQLKAIQEENVSPSSSKRQKASVTPKSERVEKKFGSKRTPPKTKQFSPSGMGSITSSTSEPEKKIGEMKSSKDVLHERDPSKSVLACSCGRKFTTKQALYSHLNHFNKEKSFVCKQCGTGFQYAYRLKNHLRKEHNVMDLSHADMLENLQESSNKTSPKAAASASGKRKRSSNTASRNTNQLNDKTKKERLSTPEVNGQDGEGGGDRNNKPGSGFNETDETTEAVPRYCLCNDVEYGEMVACDGKNCPREWFHYDCVGLTSEPKGEWFCLQCSAERKAAREV